jgi:putative DNA primase/helicase
MELLDKFLNDISLNDEVFKNYLQYIMGRLYIGENTDKSLVVFYGDGSNGKSLLLALLEAMMGESYRVISKNSMGGVKLTHQLEDLSKLRCAVINDLEVDLDSDKGWLKMISGGDSICVRLPDSEPRTYKLAFIPVIVVNHIPFKNDPVIRGRSILLHFRAHFVPEVDPNDPSHRKGDVHIQERLLNDQEFMSAFSAWVQEGARMYRENNHPKKLDIME